MTCSEVDVSPESAAVGAFFDVDGTLIAGYSASAMASDRLRRGDVSLGDLSRSLSASVQVFRGRADMGDFMKLTARGWQGRTHEELQALGDRLFEQKISDWIYPEARDLVAAHQRRGHVVALTSSATSYQVMAVARELGIEHVLCTQLEVHDGVLTGEVSGSALWGRGKADAVQRFAAEHGVDLAQSWFYADGDEDLGLMHLVGNPRPTNPGGRLALVAGRRGWPVQRFTSRGRANATTRARSAVGWLSAGPIAAASAGVGLVRRDRCAAVELSRRLWLDAMFAATGISVEVAGKQNLRADRPAVFVFNHLTEFDPLIAARVVGPDAVGLVGPDATRTPLGRALGLLGDVLVTTDRARAALTDKGLSVLAAVGTPGRGADVFGPDAFRLAMEAGVPMVPIVLRNAEALGPRRAKVIRSGTVEVAVLPAIATSDWTADDLAGHAEDVRQQFAATLRHWPAVT